MTVAKNYNEVQHKIKNSKLFATPRGKLESWYPYYAGYSSDFVESIIAHASTSKPLKDLLIYDPWAGAGTTLHTAAKQGCKVIGYDANPFIVDLALSKSPIVLNHLDDIIRFVKYIKNENPTAYPHILYGISDYFEHDSVLVLSFLINAINVECKKIAISPTNSHQSVLSFLMIALIIEATKYVPKVKVSNPTWQTTNGKGILPKNFLDLFIENIHSKISDLQDYYSSRIFSNYYNVILADNRITMPSAKADLIITSPPYLTRIDYIMSTKLELAFYVQSSKIRELRETNTGAPVVRNDSDLSPLWGNYAKSLAKDIIEHGSKASSSYYIKIYYQYIKDMYLSLDNISKSLISGGRAYFVVQSSYYKDILMDLPRLIIEMGEIYGIDGKIVSQAEINNGLAAVNTHSKKYIENKKYTEDTILFIKD